MAEDIDAIAAFDQDRYARHETVSSSSAAGLATTTKSELRLYRNYSSASSFALSPNTGAALKLVASERSGFSVLSTREA